MCLLAILYRVAADAPVVVAANREEFYDRAGDPPRRLDGVAAVGGVDPRHGGTWLGVNRHGVVVAVTNRSKSDVPAEPRSRGLLVRDLLHQPTASAAVETAVAALETGAYAGCNLLCLDSRAAVVIHAGDWLRVRPLPPGLHVLTNFDVNEPADRRIAFTAATLARQPLGTRREAIAALQAVCRSREPAEAPICFREAKRGTVSSSIVALPERRADAIYLHAQGPPDSVGYQDVSPLLRQLAAEIQER